VQDQHRRRAADLDAQEVGAAERRQPFDAARQGRGGGLGHLGPPCFQADRRQIYESDERPR
jgi:hypothetical protein